MIHPFDILTLDNGAKLIFTPCPGTKGVSIVDSLKSLKEAGAQTVITMMTMAEMTEKQADTLPSLCAELRMDWYHLPLKIAVRLKRHLHRPLLNRRIFYWG
ncbi:Uncharacterised protein [Klebsiella michiganensis]|uniref:Uncharacterized protein n=1 Tax=Klebsiella michiganensis TaxID=1134687 RepID=A0A7H4MSK5_9ENTR|nr:Uncharacterised protein [Klebsiella michiganensis]